ncbi:MAG: hypothetical protein IJ764_04030 [Bacteroidales bacterium]|nr:hypothetical protein [Bacteroidales bacterium]
MVHSQQLFLGNTKTRFTDKICAFCFAVAPILQHYRGIYENMGFTILLLTSPILLFRMIDELQRDRIYVNNLKALIPFFLFEIYSVIVRDFSSTRIFYAIFFVWVYFCIASGCLNIFYILKYAVTIGLLGTILIIIQYISHYIFHHTIDFRMLNLLVSQDMIWIRHMDMNEGMIRLYRPAGLFLEPSHFFLYTFPLITLLLISKSLRDIRKASLLSIGMLLTTSGMGIVFLIGIWGIFLLVYRSSQDRVSLRNIATPRNIGYVLIFITAFAIMYATIPIINQSITRIFYSESGSNTAIDGRVMRAQNYIETISGKDVWFGRAGITSELDFNLSGFYATYIKWGIIGLILTYWFYVQGLFKLKDAYFWLSIIIVSISFFTAHTHGTFYMLYFSLFLLNGYHQKQIKN